MKGVCMVTKKLIQEATECLVQVYDPLEIYVFGSYAWGDPTEESDMDLAVVVEESDQVALKRPISGHLALADLDVPKDIIVYTKHEFDRALKDPSTLATKIKLRGIRVYAKA